MTRALLISLLAGSLTILTLAGCSRTRTVTVQGEPPPPTTVTVTDTVWLASPPALVVRTDTLVLRDTVVVTRPVQVIRYIEPRPDSEPQFRLFGADFADGVGTFYGPRSDVRFRLPVPGERLDVAAAGPDSLTMALSGTPRTPPPVTVECPDPPDPLLANTLRGWVTLVGLLFMAGAAGAVAVAVLKP